MSEPLAIPLATPSAPPMRRRWHHIAAGAALALIALAAYSNSFHCGLTLDNTCMIRNDWRIREATRANTRLIFTEDYWYPTAVAGLYRPLTTLTYLFNYAILGSGEQPGSYHSFNLALHLGNALMLYALALTLFGSLRPAFLTAALFAAHPIAVESVTNIVGRSDMLAAASILGGLLLYIRGTRAHGWRRVAWLTGMMLVNLAGVFCKESAVALIGVLLIYDIAFRVEPKRPHALPNLIANLGSFFLRGYVALVPVWVTLAVVRHAIFSRLSIPTFPFVDNPILGADFWTGRFTAIKVIGKLLWLLVWPATLSCDYGYNQVPLVNWHFGRWEDVQAILSLVVILMLLGVAAASYRRHKALFFLILFFFVTLGPTSNLIVRIGSIMAERFVYLPMAAFVGCVVLAVEALAHRLSNRQAPWVAALILGAIVAGYGARTFARNLDWRNDVTLWTAAVRDCPDSFRSHKTLAFSLYKQSEDANIDRCIDEAAKAVAILDDVPIDQSAALPYLDYGMYCGIKGDLVSAAQGEAKARPWYERSVKILERAEAIDHACNATMRRLETQRGKKPEQIADFGLDQVYENLGVSRTRLGLLNQALAAFEYQRRLAPTKPIVYWHIASIYAKDGQLDLAAVGLIQSLLLDPSRVEAYDDLVRIYAQINPQSVPAVLMTSGKPALNAQCAIVHRHLLAAHVGLVKAMLEAKQYATARVARESALRTGYDPHPFDELFWQHNVPIRPPNP